MNTAFSFDQKQRNTLKVSGLAAYAQRPPHDRVGWVHVEEVWLPDWRPAKWAWRVQHVEITFDSYCTVEDFEAQELDFEPWDYLMVTAHEAFLTDDLREVETFFARFVDRAEFARHPNNVGFPDEFKAHERQADGDPVRWSLRLRSLVAALLHARAVGEQIIWDTADLRLLGSVHSVGLSSFQMTAPGKHLLMFGDVDALRLFVVRDGYIQQCWPNRKSLHPASLPTWVEAQGEWVLPPEESV